MDCLNATYDLLSTANSLDDDCLCVALQANPMLFPTKQASLEIFLKFPKAALKVPKVYSLIPVESIDKLTISTAFVPSPSIFEGVLNLSGIDASIFENMNIKNKLTLNVYFHQLRHIKTQRKIDLIFGNICDALPVRAVMDIPSVYEIDTNDNFQKCLVKKGGKEKPSGSIFLLRPTRVGYVTLLGLIKYEGRPVWSNTGGECDLERESTTMVYEPRLVAAVRETEEETNGLIKLDSTSILDTNYYFNKAENHFMYFTIQPLMGATSSELRNRSIQSGIVEMYDYAWVSVEDLLNLIEKTANLNNGKIQVRVLKSESSEEFEEAPQEFHLRSCFSESLKSNSTKEFLKRAMKIKPEMFLKRHIQTPFDRTSEFPNLFKGISPNILQSQMKEVFQRFLSKNLKQENKVAIFDIKGRFNTAIIAFIYEKMRLGKSLEESDDLTLDEISVFSPFVIVDNENMTEGIKSTLLNLNKKLLVLDFCLIEETLDSPVKLHHALLSHIHTEFALSNHTGLIECNTNHDPSAQAIVAVIQAAMDLPFLQLSESCFTVWKRSLPTVNDGHVSLFRKILLSSRFYNNHNQVFREDSKFSKFAIELSSKLKTNVLPLVVIPMESVYHEELNQEVEHLLSRYLIDFKAFKEKYTDNGILYHGTNSISNFIPILHNGFLRSTKGDSSCFAQGEAKFGSGLYTTKDQSTAAFYGLAGIVLSLPLKQTENIRILDFDSMKGHEVTLQRKADQLNMDLFIYLSELCKIDVILSGYVIVQNTFIFDISRNLALASLELIKKSSNQPKNISYLWTLQGVLGHDSLTCIDDFDLHQLAIAIVESTFENTNLHNRFLSKLSNVFPLCAALDFKWCLESIFEREKQAENVVSAFVISSLSSKLSGFSVALKLIVALNSLNENFIYSNIIKILDYFASKSEHFHEILHELNVILEKSPEHLPQIVKVVEQLIIPKGEAIEFQDNSFLLASLKKYGDEKIIEILQAKVPILFNAFLESFNEGVGSYPISFIISEKLAAMLKPGVLEKFVCSADFRNVLLSKEFKLPHLRQIIQNSRMQNICNGYWRTIQEVYLQQKNSFRRLYKIFPKHLNGEDALKLLQGSWSKLEKLGRLEDAVENNAKQFTFEQLIECIDFIIKNNAGKSVDKLLRGVMYDLIVFSDKSFDEITPVTSGLFKHLNAMNLKKPVLIYFNDIDSKLFEMWLFFTLDLSFSLDEEDGQNGSSAAVQNMNTFLIKWYQKTNKRPTLKKLNQHSLNSSLLYFAEVREKRAKQPLMVLTPWYLNDLSANEMTEIIDSYFYLYSDYNEIPKTIQNCVSSRLDFINATFAVLQSAHFSEEDKKKVKNVIQKFQRFSNGEIVVHAVS